MKTVKLDDPQAEELLWIVRDPKIVMSQGLRDQVFAALYVPPAVVPPAWIAPPALTSYDPVTALEAQWGQPFTRDLSMGPRGMVTVSFIAGQSTQSGSASVAAYPGTMRGRDRKISIGTSPGDFSQAWPWSLVGYDTGMYFNVIPTQARGVPSLTPGVRYYLSLANIDTRPLDTSDIRLAIHWPQ